MAWFQQLLETDVSGVQLFSIDVRHNPQWIGSEKYQDGGLWTWNALSKHVHKIATRSQLLYRSAIKQDYSGIGIQQNQNKPQINYSSAEMCTDEDRLRGFG